MKKIISLLVTLALIMSAICVSAIPMEENQITYLAENGINIEYMYGLSVETNDASIVVKTNEIEQACSILKNSHIDTMSEQEISSL